MKLRPLHDRILAQRIEEKEQVRGGIVVPDTARKNRFGKYSGTEVKLDEDDYLILREDDVLGILEK